MPFWLEHVRVKAPGCDAAHDQREGPLPPPAGAMPTNRSDNPMRQIRIEKLVLNISVRGSGDCLTRAAMVLEQLTKQQPAVSKARLNIRQFGVRRNEKIACNVTVLGEKAEDLLEKGLKVKECELRKGNFIRMGSFGFGIYDPSVRRPPQREDRVPRHRPRGEGR